jgi:hypothetical protein
VDLKMMLMSVACRKCGTECDLEEKEADQLCEGCKVENALDVLGDEKIGGDKPRSRVNSQISALMTTEPKKGARTVAEIRAAIVETTGMLVALKREMSIAMITVKRTTVTKRVFDSWRVRYNLGKAARVVMAHRTSTMDFLGEDEESLMPVADLRDMGPIIEGLKRNQMTYADIGRAMRLDKTELNALREGKKPASVGAAHANSVLSQVNGWYNREFEDRESSSDWSDIIEEEGDMEPGWGDEF